MKQIQPYLDKLEKLLDLYFGKKAPVMPDNIKEFLVKISPYMVILAIVAIISSYSSLFGISRFMPAFYYRPVFSLSLVANLISLVIEGMAIPGLFKRTKKAWDLVFYATLVMLLGRLLSFDLGSLIIGGIISFYVLFQIKSLYK